MGHRYADIAFTDRVKALQQASGSRGFYEKLEGGPESNAVLTPAETDFIVARDSFYIASVGETGWPYLQHRGGPEGFLRVLSESRLGFADFRGNRQYLTVGNAAGDDRVSLFLMDYAKGLRLKLFGRLTATDDPAIVEGLAVPGYPGRIEYAVLIDVEAYDWNCPRHIPRRFTEAEMADRMAPLEKRIAELETQLQMIAA
jgi:predicted pyridoxine 5'-phosphate oxidase superfamily flavin-nucleotide-binding protein